MEIGGELKNDILSKLYRFLTYQERCRQDIVSKLYKLSIPERFHQDYIQHLEEENYLNEERFCNQFVKSKIRGNKWGRKKVAFALQQKGVQPSDIDKALEGFSTEEYANIAIRVAEKKNKTIKTDDIWKRKQKLYKYLAQKGFETSIINTTLERVLNKQK